jgi:transposase
MVPHTTNEMREYMVAWHPELGKSDIEIAALANCSECTVCEVIQLHHTFGVVHNLFAQPCGGHRSLTTGDLNFISSLLVANPCLYLDKLQDQLATDQDTHVSISTVSCAVRSLALSRKHVSAAAMERNELLCATWQAEYGDIPTNYFVWLDESSVDDCTNQCTHGWAALVVLAFTV